MLIKNLFRHWTYQVFSPGTVLREKYESFKTLLAHDRTAHEQLAVLEDLYYNCRAVDFEYAARTYEAFAASVRGMVDALLAMNPTGYWSLKAYFKKFDFYVRFMLAPPEFDLSPPFILELDTSTTLDEKTVGKKAAVLNVLNRDLHLPVPGGFVITTRAYHYFMEANGLGPAIKKKLADLDIHDPASLDRTAGELQETILEAPLPDPLMTGINDALERLQSGMMDHRGSGKLRFAMRSSAVREDGHASFAGQYESLMNLSRSDAARGYKQVVASKYSSRALSYRIRCGIPDHETPMAVLVLEMINTRSAGVMYTRDMENPGSEGMVIHSAWGLGGLVVDGRVSVDEIRTAGREQILEKNAGIKKSKLVPNRDGPGTRVLDTGIEERKALSLDEPEILTLSRWAENVENHFDSPQDIEWCLDRNGLVFILQARPLRQIPVVSEGSRPASPAVRQAPLCSRGQTICGGQAAGPLFVLNNLSRMDQVPENAVVAATFGLPQYVTIIDRISGIILQTGCTAGHFASIAREFGLPAIVAPDGFDDLEAGQTVTLDADTGRVYEGRIDSLLSNPSQKTGTDAFSDSSMMTILRYLIRFCADLKLTDPGSDQFVPEQCRSLHDILRFAHETAVREMFFMGERRGARKKGARQLVSGLPMLFYVLDVGSEEGSGMKPSAEKEPLLRMEHLNCVPLKALFQGLSHPGICWDEASHFDWESYDKIVMAGGIISADSPQFGSYAVVSETYMNVSLRFGYHFVILDTMCTHEKKENYILFRFSGGGGNAEGRWLRAGFIGSVLKRLGFIIEMTSDLIDARLIGADEQAVKQALDQTGRLLGATKLMDMYLKNDTDINQKADEFMAGRYDFRAGPGEGS